MDFFSLLNTVITLALLLITGFLLKKGNILTDSFTKSLSELIVKIGQPALILSSLITLDFSVEKLKMGLISLAISVCLHSFIALIAHFLVKFRKDFDERKITEFTLIFTNCGFIGFPIIKSLYGEEGLFCGAFYLIGFHLFIWTLGIFILSRGRSDIKPTPRKIFINLGTVPCVIGFIIFLLPFRLPVFITDTVSYLASLCTPVSMLIIGSLIASENLKKFFFSAGNYISSAFKLLLIPAIVCPVLKLIGLSDFFVTFGTVMTALPSATVVTMFCELYDIKPSFSSRLVGLSSILCTFTLPVMVLYSNFIISVFPKGLFS